MRLNAAVEVAGFVKMEVYGGKRGKVEVPWFPNMILDGGIRNLLTSPSNTTSIMRSVTVGSSSVPVSPSDTWALSPIAGVNQNENSSASFKRGFSEDGYGYTQKEFIFARGQAAGNISELTLNFDSQNIPNKAHARTLVKNSSGEPTTITVLDDEVLKVTWELRRWWKFPENSFVKYFRDGVEHETEVIYPDPTLFSGIGTELGSGGDLPITGQTGGANLAGNLLEDFISEFGYRFLENSGNPSVSSVHFPFSGGYSGTLVPNMASGKSVKFDPPIQKGKEFVLDVYFNVAIKRRS